MSNNKKSNKRLKSTKEYIDALSKDYSKLNIVRIDLGYKKPYSEATTLDDANKDLDRMFNNMRSKPTIFKDKVGYVCKKEYTKEKGMHIHALFIFNGQTVHKDAFKGDEIGQYWEQITEERGSYHNCNRKKYKHDGIGMLDYKDSDKRKILDDKVVSYLCKDDEKQDIAPIKSNKNSRAFTRGIISKSKGNIGRPRK